VPSYASTRSFYQRRRRRRWISLESARDLLPPSCTCFSVPPCHRRRSDTSLPTTFVPPAVISAYSPDAAPPFLSARSSVLQNQRDFLPLPSLSFTPPLFFFFFLFFTFCQWASLGDASWAASTIPFFSARLVASFYCLPRCWVAIRLGTVTGLFSSLRKDSPPLRHGALVFFLDHLQPSSPLFVFSVSLVSPMMILPNISFGTPSIFSLLFLFLEDSPFFSPGGNLPSPGNVFFFPYWPHVPARLLYNRLRGG